MKTTKAKIGQIIVVAFASSGIASGAPVDSKGAATAVEGWLRGHQTHLQTFLGRPSNNVKTFTNSNGIALYHIVNLDPDGFVIVAADDRIEPIICFSPHGQFAPSPENPLFTLVNKDLPSRMAKVKSVKVLASQPQQADSASSQKWAALQSSAQQNQLSPMNVAVVSDLRVAPLIKTLWDQSTVSVSNACYNYYTPPYAAGTSSNYPSGCIATALAQLLYYWRYPVTGVGTGSHTIYVNSSPQLKNLRGGDGSGGAYDWGNMVLDPAGGCTLVQRQAIGALCCDAGTAVGMSYRNGSSATAAWLQQYALTTVFGYSNAICSESIGPTGTLATADFINMINPNLDAGCPVLLGIAGDLYGHAIVCDGYGYNMSTLYHHMNMGWGGYDNAWYALPLIDPDYLSYNFDLIQTVNYNIWTNKTGEIISGRVITAGGGTPIPGALVTARCASGGVYTVTSDANGIYALAQIPSLSTFTVSVVKAGCTFDDQIVSSGWSTNFGFASGNRWGFDLPSAEPTVSLGLSGSPMVKTGATATVTVTLSKTNASPVTVNLAFSGTAVIGADYTVSATNLTIVPGALSSAVTLTVVTNTQKRGTESVLVDIDTVVNASELGVQQVTALIVDGPLPPDAPTNFHATVVDSGDIILSWAHNASNDNVLVAWNISSNFGIPFGVYSTNDWISGGGAVLYDGSATNVTQACLASGTSYYYQAWSVRGGSNYSEGQTCSATTSNHTALPYTYGFENATDFFTTWHYEFICSNISWNISGLPHTGATSTSFWSPTAMGAKTKLLAPKLDFGSGVQSAQLTFWYYVSPHAGTQDALRVYYKTGAAGSYTLLAEYTNSAPSAWISNSLALPNPGSSYVVAFEGEVKGGYGVNLDDVSISACYPAASSFTAWTQLRCPGASATNAFSQDRDNDGVPNGFEYAFGTNWVAGTPLLNIRLVSGVPVVEVPKPDAAASPYVATCVESSSNLVTPAWNTNNIHAVTGAGKPANCNWFQPYTVGSNSFFRLRATLLE